jgi:excinuclease ABC subunit C
MYPIAEVPQTPGVYQMLGKWNEVLYVGKAKNLRKRIASYFRSNLDTKTSALMEHVADIKFIITANETEALLLENNLIKDLKPKYNILFKDDKSYPYLFISKGEFPRISIHRGSKKASGHYYGPYPNASAANEVLVTLQKIFKLRRCSDIFFRNRSRACLQYQIKRCSAPCVNYVDAKAYQENAALAEKFLKGHSKEIINVITKKMQLAAKKLQYENAANYRNQIESLQTVSQQQHIIQSSGDIDVISIVQQLDHFSIQILFIRDGKIIGSKVYFPVSSQLGIKEEALSAFLSQYYIGNIHERPMPRRIMLNLKLADRSLLEKILNQELARKITISTPSKGVGRHWIKMAETNAEAALVQSLTKKNLVFKGLLELKDILKLEKLPARLECFDVSHTMGEAAVASCVAFNQLGPLKSAYRRYNITGITKGDDYAGLEQALTRHYRTHAIPDLIIIDGGKGQLTRAVKALGDKSAILLGIAKGKSRKPGLETIYATTAKGTVSLGRFSNALKILQQIRDEAHRFAITSHRKKFIQQRLQTKKGT